MAAPSKNRPPKPGKNYYWNGREWVWIAQRQPSKPKPTATPKPPPPRKPAPQTTQQWADAQAQKIVDAQLAAIQQQQTAWQEGLRAEAARRAQQAQAFAQMVQGMGIDKNIQGIFSNAGHDVAGYGAGFSGEVRDIADRSAAETINLLGGDATGVRNEGEGMGNVLHGVGGFIPSASLAAQGAAFAADAAMQPGFMLQQGLLEAERDFAEKSSQNPFLDAILEAKLSKHDIATSLKEERIGMNMKAAEMRLDQIESDRDYWLKMQALYLSQKKYKLAAQAEKRARDAERRYAMETQGRDAYGDVAPGFYQHKSGRILKDGTTINSKGEVVKLSTARKPGKDKSGKSEVTANAQAEWVDKVWAAQDNMVDYAKQVIERYQVFPPSGPPAPSKIALLKRELMKRFSHLGRNHQTKQALRKLVSQVVDDMMRGGGASGSGLFD